MTRWKLVPVKATDEMKFVGSAASYRAMLAVAPEPPEEVIERMVRAFVFAGIYDDIRDFITASNEEGCRNRMRLALMAAMKGGDA